MAAFRLKGYFRCLRLSVRPFVRLSVHKFNLVRMITRHIFILTEIIKFASNMLVLNMGAIDIDLQDHFGHFNTDLQDIWLVRVITCNVYELESPNLHQLCILGVSLLVLKMGTIHLYHQGHLAISTQNSTKRHSTSLLYIDQIGPRGFTRPIVLLYCLLEHNIIDVLYFTISGKITSESSRVQPHPKQYK